MLCRLGVVHRNLRLEKLLLDGTSASAVLKISGFAYSKAPALDSGGSYSQPLACSNIIWEEW